MWLCGHRDGCLPYAKAITEGEEANKCVPGGQPVADALAALLKRPHLTAEASVWPMQADGLPTTYESPLFVRMRCIGCTKCISACPVDAIIGSGKLMHTVLTDLCTGCELCIPPCPVDCIDLVEDIAIKCHLNLFESQNRMIYVAATMHIFNVRKSAEFIVKALLYAQKLIRNFLPNFLTEADSVPVIEVVEKPATPVVQLDAKTTIELAKIRTQIKKLEKQLSVRDDAKKREVTPYAHATT